MRFQNLHDRLEVLWINAKLELESQYNAMFAFLESYRPPSTHEVSLEYILSNPPLSGTEVAEPQNLFNAYITFKGGIYSSNEGFPPKKRDEQLPPILVSIVLSENLLLLLEGYHAQIQSEGQTIYDLKRAIRETTSVLEYGAAVRVQNISTRVSLYNAYLRNWKQFKSRDEPYLDRTAKAICRIIVDCTQANIPISDDEMEEYLKTLNDVVKGYRKKGIEFPYGSLHAVWESLQEASSQHTNVVSGICRKVSKNNKNIKSELRRQHRRGRD